MTDTIAPSPPPQSAEKAITLALSLAHAEHALHAFTSGQVDAIVDSNGQAYLLRPAQEHLRQNERRLQTVIDSAADVITVLNRDGTILSQSMAVRRVLGYAHEELVGRDIFDFVHPDDLPDVYFAFTNVSEEFCTHATIAFRHRVRDGAWRLLEAALGKVHDSSTDGKVVLTLRDRTRNRHDSDGVMEAKL